MKERGQGSPDIAPSSQRKPNQKEQGSVRNDSNTGTKLAPLVGKKEPDKLSLTPAGETKIEGDNPERTLFDCVIPKITFDKAHPGLSEPCEWFLRLQERKITEEKAQECEQYWREEYKTWDKQKLEENIKDLEEHCTNYVRRFPEEDAQHFKYEIELKRQELRRRQNRSDS